ncbi:MAG: hypothetical protein V3U53_03880 [bacterium]
MDREKGRRRGGEKHQYSPVSWWHVFFSNSLLATPNAPAAFILGLDGEVLNSQTLF